MFRVRRKAAGLVGTAVAAGLLAASAGARVAAEQATPVEQTTPVQIEHRALLLATSTLSNDPSGAGNPGGAPSSGPWLQRYWLGAALDGRSRLSAGGSRWVRGVLAFSAAGSRPQVRGVSLGATLIQRRLVGAGALFTTSAQLWTQWDRQLVAPQGLFQLEGSVAAGRLGGTARVWYGTQAFDPWPTWAGEALAGVGLAERWQATGSGGASAVVRQALGSGRYRETRLGWQESVTSGSPDTPELGYSLRWVIGNQRASGGVRAALGVRWRPNVGSQAIPQAGLGFTLRRVGQGDQAPSLTVDLLADLGTLQGSGTSGGASHTLLVAALGLDLPLGHSRLSLKARYPSAGMVDPLAASGWAGDWILHLQLQPPWPSDAKAAGGRLDLVAAYAASTNRISAGAAWVF